MIKILLAFGIALSIPAFTYARGAGDKHAQQVFVDQTNRSETFAVITGSVTNTKVHTPSARRGGRDERNLRLQNTASSGNLHITTYTVNNTTVFLASVTVNSFIIPAGEYLDLSPNTTWYARW